MSEHEEALLNVLDLDYSTLQYKEQEQLKQLILECAQLFALTPLELGCIELGPTCQTQETVNLFISQLDESNLTCES